jgi:hypothetical protein
MDRKVLLIQRRLLIWMMVQYTSRKELSYTDLVTNVFAGQTVMITNGHVHRKPVALIVNGVHGRNGLPVKPLVTQAFVPDVVSSHQLLEVAKPVQRAQVQRKRNHVKLMCHAKYVNGLHGVHGLIVQMTVEVVSNPETEQQTVCCAKSHLVRKNHAMSRLAQNQHRAEI